MNCAFHSGMEAVYKCTSCGADICDTCRIIVKNEDYCKKCVAQKLEGAAKRARPQMGCLAAFLVTALIIFITIPIVAFLAAIAIPNFIKARQEAMGRGPAISIKSESATVETKSQEPVTSQNNTFSDMISMRKAEMYKVYLRNGQIFEAEIVKDNQDAYVFKIGNGTFEVSKQEVVEIKKME